MNALFSRGVSPVSLSEITMPKACVEAAERVHVAGMRVGTWISDDPDEAVGLMQAGVDAVATNDPGRILAARRRAFGT